MILKILNKSLRKVFKFFLSAPIIIMIYMALISCKFSSFVPEKPSPFFHNLCYERYLSGWSSVILAEEGQLSWLTSLARAVISANFIQSLAKFHPTGPTWKYLFRAYLCRPRHNKYKWTGANQPYSVPYPHAGRSSVLTRIFAFATHRFRGAMEITRSSTTGNWIRFPRDTKMKTRTTTRIEER